MTALLEDRTDAEIRRLLAAVGGRVRAARLAAGLSRRALSERSGVSERYLVQLEGGEGNASIAVLLRLALALDRRIEWFFGEDEKPAATQRRIAFIGLRGAGKSTLGRLTAERLGLPFRELNDEIEAMSGMAVNEIIALYGQEGYRRLERRALEQTVQKYDDLVLAVAGGIVANPQTFDLLLANYRTVWLQAAPEEHMARVRAQGDERPMAGNPDAMNQLRDILTEREAEYARADLSVDTSGRALDDSVSDVLKALAN